VMSARYDCLYSWQWNCIILSAEELIAAGQCDCAELYTTYN